jgi:hypothetical protein
MWKPTSTIIALRNALSLNAQSAWVAKNGAKRRRRKSSNWLWPDMARSPRTRANLPEGCGNRGGGAARPNSGRGLRSDADCPGQVNFASFGQIPIS